jgi:hypothetical protein
VDSTRGDESLNRSSEENLGIGSRAISEPLGVLDPSNEQANMRPSSAKRLKIESATFYEN